MQAGLYEQVVNLVLEGQLESLPPEAVCLERLDHADILFITLNKAEKHYSPTTMYEDYAISDTLFHWQSQSRTTEESDTGQRYIHHKRRNNLILLFVREDRTNRGNLAEPYHFLGSADYVSHTGSRPMSITWQLNYPMPAHLLQRTSRLAVG